MKIVLVHPAPKIWTRAALVPLGLAYLAAFLETSGFNQIEVVDYNIEPEARLPKADLVAITATTPLIKSAWQLARKAKKQGSLTVIGGPHVSALPRESLAKKEVDFVVIGEGEETFLELCRALVSAEKNFNGIKGLGFKRAGKMILNQPREFIKNLDSLPLPAYHLFKLDLYTSTQPLISVRKPALGILTSRGCPYGCRFCYKGTFGRSWRPRSVESVLTEWEYLVRLLKVKEIALMDDGFNIDINRAVAICKGIKKRGLVIPWRAHNGIRADRAPKKLLEVMRDSGCYQISFGIESGCQSVLNLMDKQLNLKDVSRTINNCRQLGIMTMAFFMIGFPGETAADIKKTISFSLELNPDLAQFSVATPFPGTPIFNLIRKETKIKLSDWDKFSQFDQKGYFDYADLTAREIARLASLAYRRFYLRPRVICRLLKRKETWLNLSNIIAGSAHYLLQKDI